ncbi:hypothetical protein B0F90DRAFT_1032530 [Multifurca ochricompacta]|uniref:Fungal STAND N-terminal Goodbye domain-containing protein n=1 Tax=Multifurca ochricompacta TaxID=376703 RepID=A0AAD4QK60_9AGAM|nr:hypothetical protein B0F90DRAFT_1032530 [Multifurca ochricompacta]
MSTRTHAAILPSNIETLFANALKDYAIQTGDDLATHPLFSKIKSCDSVESIAAVLQEQADAFHKFRKRDQKVAKWLEPTINVINMLSGTLSEAVSLAFPPGKVIFAGIGILLVAFQGVNASYDVLDGLFESISHFLMRLKIYSEIPSTPAIAEIIAKILIELISVLALATKEVKQGRLSEYIFSYESLFL